MLTGDSQSAAMQAQEQVCDVIFLIPNEYNMSFWFYIEVAFMLRNLIRRLNAVANTYDKSDFTYS